MKNANSPATHAPTVTTPLHRHDDVVVRLQKSDVFRDYQQAFQTATGLPLVLRATGAFQAPMQGARNVNPFCALIMQTSKTCASCLELQARAEREAALEAKTVECMGGLHDSLVPIKLGDAVVAFLQTGQVLFRPPTEKQFQPAVKAILKLNPAADVDALRAAYLQSRVLARPHYEAMLRLLVSFAQHLSLVANELMIQTTAAEPPAVTRARAYLNEHLTDDLSLQQVARAAGMSAFYFCKVFKAGTGLTFTNYLARTRVEKTKQILSNPHARVSEAAFEAGFQSLSQFNRVFRRIEGQSPTSYRDHLHSPDSPRPKRRSFACAA